MTLTLVNPPIAACAPDAIRDTASINTGRIVILFLDIFDATLLGDAITGTPFARKPQASNQLVWRSHVIKTPFTVIHRIARNGTRPYEFKLFLGARRPYLVIQACESQNRSNYSDDDNNPENQRLVHPAFTFTNIYFGIYKYFYIPSYKYLYPLNINTLREWFP
jgi:hypothetical protein